MVSHFGGADEHREARIGGELRKAFRRRIVVEHIDIARHQRRVSRARIGDEFEGDFIQCRGPAPVVGIARQRERIAAPPLARIETDPCRSAVIALVAAECGETMTKAPKARDCSSPPERRRKRDLAAVCASIDLDGTDGARPRSLRIDRVRPRCRGPARISPRLHQRGCRHESGPPAANETRRSIRRPRCPRSGELRQHRTVSRELHQPFEHIAVQTPPRWRRPDLRWDPESAARAACRWSRCRRRARPAASASQGWASRAARNP